MDRVHAKLDVGLEWSEVRLSETEKQREKTRHEGENGSATRWSVEWSSDWSRRTVEALSLSLSHTHTHWCMGLRKELRFCFEWIVKVEYSDRVREVCEG